MHIPTLRCGDCTKARPSRCHHSAASPSKEIHAEFSKQAPEWFRKIGVLIFAGAHDTDGYFCKLWHNFDFSPSGFPTYGSRTSRSPAL